MKAKIKYTENVVHEALAIYRVRWGKILSYANHFRFVMLFFHVQFMFLNKIILYFLLLLLHFIPEQC